jgi:hypothetical protein
MYRIYATAGIAVAIALSGARANAAEIKVGKTALDIQTKAFDDSTWKGVPTEVVSLMAQPMAIPRPKTTETQDVRVQAVHDGKWIAFRLTWKDGARDTAGKLGEFSDAVAMQFPIKPGAPPPIFMGSKDNPVHIFHWRAQYQRDRVTGKPEMTDLYPNMNPDMYPMEFKDSGNIPNLDNLKREVYAPGKAEGNPQSYAKSGVDEIFAEGFGSSSVVQEQLAIGLGVWHEGAWSVVVARPLALENGSTLESGKNSHIAFAVWQGGKQEVGSRKSVTMSWVPISLAGTPEGTKP